MKKTLVRMLSLLLASVMVLTCLTACGGGSDEKTSAARRVRKTPPARPEKAQCLRSRINP